MKKLLFEIKSHNKITINIKGSFFFIDGVYFFGFLLKAI